MKISFRNLFKPKTAVPLLSLENAQLRLNEGLALHQQGQLAQAKAIYEQVLGVQPSHFDALHLLGVISYQTGESQRALDLIGKAIAVNPREAAAYGNRGTVLKALGRWDEALASYEQGIALQADNAEFFNNRGIVLKQLKRFEDALASYERAIQLKHDYAEAYNYRGNVLREINRADEALASYDQAIKIKIDYAEAYNNRAVLLHQLKQLEDAIASYTQAITIKADYAEACKNRGMALQALGRLEEALESYGQAIALNADDAAAHNNRGATLHGMRRWKEALESYDKAIACSVDHAEAHNNRGVTLQEMQRWEDALKSYDTAIALKTEYAEAHNNRGVTLQAMKRWDAALKSYEQAIAISADYAYARINRGVLLQEMKRFDEALASFSQVMTIAPHHEFMLGTLLHSKMHMCNWENHGEDANRLEAQVRSGKKVSDCLPILAISGSPDIQRLAAEIWINEKFPENRSLGVIAKHARSNRIRVGYFSADFNMHAVSLLTAALFETHDRGQFEIYAFDFGRKDKDDMTTRLESAFDHFIDCKSRTDEEIAGTARKLNIDIAVDLGGFTRDSRPGIFSYRAAPIQLGYLGFPATMGAPYMDYLVADRIVIPEQLVNGYTEKIAYLPCYQVNDNKKEISERTFTRQELGLPDSGFVFCCLNNNYKITPDVFKGWMNILKAVDGSVLWLLKDNAWAGENLLKAAETCGIDPRRMVFSRRMKLPDYLASYRTANLFLDTLPFNAGTTASDALWAGLPVLTCMGEAFAGRMAGSLLHAIGLPELITHTQAEYESTAIELATHPQKLVAIREKLKKNRLTTPLFDTKSFTLNLESAYTQMYERYMADLPPDHIQV